MEFESDPQSMPTLTFGVPDEATFERLMNLTELPECVLEVTETRQITDEYLDTKADSIHANGSSLRLATVGGHHFLIYEQRPSAGRLLILPKEFVERVTPAEYAAQQDGDRSHALYDRVATTIPGMVSPRLTRRATFQSRLFRIGETRFELGLEAIHYSDQGRTAADQLVQIELIEGDGDIILAIGEYLTTEYELTPVLERPFERGRHMLDFSPNIGS